jgi:hypothetical protein
MRSGLLLRQFLLLTYSLLGVAVDAKPLTQIRLPPEVLVVVASGKSYRSN